MSDPAPITVLVIDDHPVLREGIASLLANHSDMVLIGEARNGIEGVEMFRRHRPDVTLMDLQMPSMGGVEAIGEIRADFPEARIVVLTTYAGDAQAVRALKAGAAGYLLKSSLRTEMLDAIRNVHRGLKHIHRDVADGIALHVVDEPLNDREIEVLALIAEGHSNKSIGAELAVSAETIKGYLKAIFAKLSVTDRTHAVTVAVRRGILDL